ncbi:DUF2460 domain-containing protein [Chelativorans sp. Marseille-P2723]|uniref:DUF2460 domain-containing protein n=1 Tax=Chelativorans sp. Marseille-P2723 TaxID=2709133 RepID=UPI00156DDB3A|nr:DUF2460 domain-containing protein [Chelativorans sp. Marseille-P2723]
MDSFHDVRFPLGISFGATGGPERANEIVELTSGREKRNARTAGSRRRYDAGTGVRSLEDLYEVIGFFEARRGSLHAFRFRDPFDMKSCAPHLTPSALDQPIGIGDGSQNRFALIKTYGEGPDAYQRRIVLPVPGTVRVAVAGVMKAEGPDFTVDNGTGEIVFGPGSLPGREEAVTAGYEFDVSVRFDTERLTASITAFKAGQIPSIPLVEVL